MQWSASLMITVFVFVMMLIVDFLDMFPPKRLANMIAKGVIPFSVLFTSSFVRDGHGMLPLLSYTVKDSILIKILNLLFGLGIGMILYLIGW